MSNALAIATVTTALAQIVREAAQSIVDGADVITGRPTSSSGPVHCIHLFLYQVTFNGAMRNNDLPTRALDGTLITRPAAALDLHYLITAYGNETELEAQRMLGAVLRDLRARPVLTRAMIQNAIESQPFLSGSDLAEAVETVKFTPENLSIEDMSRFWSVFYQTPYALSVGYRGTVVVIETDDTVSTPVPVLKRGETNRGVETFTGPFPVMESVYFGMPTDVIGQSRPPSFPAARFGLSVIVRGCNLGGESTFLRFTHSKLNLICELDVSSADVSPTELKTTLPLPMENGSQTKWAPGVYTVTAIDRQQGGLFDKISNSLPIALSPTIAAIEPGTTITRDDEGTAALTITCTPRVHPTQQAILLLAGKETVGEPDALNPDKIHFLFRQAPAVTNAIVRIRIDNIESQPYIRIDVPGPSRFEFDPNQKVTIL